MVTEIDQKRDLRGVLDLFEQLKAASLELRKEGMQARKQRLATLRTWIKANRGLIQQAVFNDFKKPAAEVDTTEIFPALDEIKLALDNLHRWAKPKLVDAPFTMLGTRASIVYEP